MNITNRLYLGTPLTVLAYVVALKLNMKYFLKKSSQDSCNNNKGNYTPTNEFNVDMFNISVGIKALLPTQDDEEGIWA